MKIFCDYNINVNTDLDRFKHVHKHFKDAIVLHTIAVDVKSLENHPDLIDYIKTQNIDVQIVENGLPGSIEKVHELFGEYPSMIYMSDGHNTTLEQYIESNGEVEPDVIIFSSADGEADLLPVALEIYNSKR